MFFWFNYALTLIPVLVKLSVSSILIVFLSRLLLLFVIGLQAVRHAWIMRRCGLEQICCSNPVPTSDSGQSSPGRWVPNPYYLSLTRRSNMHFNDKGQMHGYIGNANRERNERRTDTGAPISHTGTLSYLACDTRDLVLLYQTPQETITQQRENLLLHVGLNIFNLPFWKFSGFQNCGLEPVTPSMRNTEVFRSEPLAHAGTI